MDSDIYLLDDCLSSCIFISNILNSNHTKLIVDVRVADKI